MKIILASPRGFCSGVKHAIDLAEKILRTEKKPVYIFHELVHNQTIVNELKTKGAVFVDDMTEIPDGSVVIFSAHGVSKKIKQQAEQKHLKIFDATCAIVQHIHRLIQRVSAEKKECLLIGHAKHPEVEGALGQYDGEGIYLIENLNGVAQLILKNPATCIYVTQTTLSADETKNIIAALHQKFPELPQQSGNICHATQERQNAVKELAKQANKIIVIGSQNSSNSTRLKELAEQFCPAFLVDSPQELSLNDFSEQDIIGITAGASAPEKLVQETIAWFQKNF